MSAEIESGNAPNVADPTPTPTGDPSAAPTPQPATTPPSGDAAPAQPAPNPNAPVFAPGTAGAPTWLQGKSATEVAQIAQQMADALASGQQMNVQPVSHPTNQFQPQPTPDPAQAVSMPNQDAWMTAPEQAAQQLQTYTQHQLTQQFGPQLQQTSQQLASNARALAAQAHSDDFNRWGPEIDMAIQTMPVEQRTYEMYEQAVNLIRGRHSEELANERAEALVQQRIEEMQGAGTLRSGTAPGGATALPDNVLDLETLKPEVAESFHHNQVDQRAMDEFLLKRKPYGDIPLEAARKKYMKAISQGSAATAEVA